MAPCDSVSTGTLLLEMDCGDETCDSGAVCGPCVGATGTEALDPSCRRWQQQNSGGGPPGLRIAGERVLEAWIQALTVMFHVKRDHIRTCAEGGRDEECRQ